MVQTFSSRVIHFLSDHFEVIIAVNGAFLLASLAAIAFLKLREIDILGVLYRGFKQFLYAAVIIGQIALVATYVHVYRKNYKLPAPTLSSLDERILDSIHWVKDNTRIYFIDGKTLGSVRVNDEGPETVFTASDPIREYHFAPDGTRIIAVTQSDLFLIDLETKQGERIDTLRSDEVTDAKKQEAGLKGSISGVRWAPDSRKFVYEVARWSQFASQDSVFLYDLVRGTKERFESPARRISSLYWDRQGENLYYLYHESKGPGNEVSDYDVRVYRIPLETLKPELIVRIPHADRSVPIENLDLRGIDLFTEGEKLSFGVPGKENDLVSEKGARIGIDKNDNLYFMKGKWFRKRLYKVPREPREAEIPVYQYGGGDLVIDHMRWIPGGRYVIMEHSFWGVLILEPATGRLGILLRANGHTFGWYRRVV